MKHAKRAAAAVSITAAALLGTVFLVPAAHAQGSPPPPYSAIAGAPNGVDNEDQINVTTHSYNAFLATLGEECFILHTGPSVSWAKMLQVVDINHNLVAQDYVNGANATGTTPDGSTLMCASVDLNGDPSAPNTLVFWKTKFLGMWYPMYSWDISTGGAGFTYDVSWVKD